RAGAYDCGPTGPTTRPTLSTTRRRSRRAGSALAHNPRAILASFVFTLISRMSFDLLAPGFAWLIRTLIRPLPHSRVQEKPARSCGRGRPTGGRDGPLRLDLRPFLRNSQSTVCAGVGLTPLQSEYGASGYVIRVPRVVPGRRG